MSQPDALPGEDVDLVCGMLEHLSTIDAFQLALRLLGNIDQFHSQMQATLKMQTRALEAAALAGVLPLGPDLAVYTSLSQCLRNNVPLILKKTLNPKEKMRVSQAIDIIAIAGAHAKAIRRSMNGEMVEEVLTTCIPRDILPFPGVEDRSNIDGVR